MYALKYLCISFVVLRSDILTHYRDNKKIPDSSNSARHIQVRIQLNATIFNVENKPLVIADVSYTKCLVTLTKHKKIFKPAAITSQNYPKCQVPNDFENYIILL